MRQEFPQRPVFTSRRMEQQWNITRGIKMVRGGLFVAEVVWFFNVSTHALFE